MVLTQVVTLFYLCLNLLIYKVARCQGTVSMKKQKQNDSAFQIPSSYGKGYVFFSPPFHYTNMKCFYLIEINQRNFSWKMFFSAPFIHHNAPGPQPRPTCMVFSIIF